VILLVAIVLSIDSEVVIAVCTNTDTYTLSIDDPNGVVIRTDQQVIDPEDGDDCNTATSNTAKLSVSCQIEGDYTAEIICDECSDAGHSATADTVILSCYAPEVNKFVLKNSSSGIIAAFDEKGYLYLRGFNFSGQSDLSPTPNSFIIRNKTNQVVAYINSTGSLFLSGSLTLSNSQTSAPKNSFIIRNGTGAEIVYINDAGNMVLEGKLYFNWTDPI